MGRVSSISMARRAPGRRAVVVSVAAALALAAAGCVAGPTPAPPAPPAPPSPPTHPAEVCAARAPASASEYQAALDAIYDGRVGGWIANDGGVPIRLPDNRTLWLFGDTLLAGGGFASNGFVVQTGACFRPITEPLPDPAPGQFYWPTGGVIEGSQLHIVAYRASGGADFQFVQMDVLTYSLPGLALVSSRRLDLPNHPGYGEVVATPDGVYAYAGLRPPSVVTNGPLEFERYAARAESVFGPWTFWDGTGWNPDPEASSPLLWDDHEDASASAGEGPLFGGLNVRPHNGGYIATAFRLTPYSKDVIEKWTAPTPIGPWSLDGDVVDIRSYDTLGDQQLAYGGHVITDLPGSPLVVWSINHLDLNTIKLIPDLYKVRVAPAAL